MNLSFFKLGERLRNKIFLGVALVALVPFIISGVFSVYLVNRSHSDDVVKVQTNLLNGKAIEVKKYVSESIDQLNLSIAMDNTNQSIVRYLQPFEDFVDQSRVLMLRNGKRIVLDRKS